jgi:SAM-dependent methyltransferase
VSCRVCGAGDPRHKLDKGPVEIFECGECGLAWWEPDPDHRAEDVYDATYFSGAGASHGYDDYAGLEESLRASFRRRIARIPRDEPGARLLDVGAAYGFAVSESAAAGWHAAGIEVSGAAARVAGGTAPGRIVAGDGLQLPFRDACFDAITLWDVLEHLSDPHAAVREISRLLRPGGRLVLTTGDVGSAMARLSGGSWHLYTLPEHLFFYTRESLRRLLAAHRLRVESMRAEASYYTLGYLAERLRKTLLGKTSKAPTRWPGSALRVPVNLYDIVTVTAQRAPDPRNSFKRSAYRGSPNTDP